MLNMETSALAQKLHECIKEGDFPVIQVTLEPINDVEQIRNIEACFVDLFPGVDPVNFAIENREEKIGIYLVEKYFSTDKIYQWPGKMCDAWCNYDHGCDKCSVEFTAEDNAERKNLYKLKQVIEDINAGVRKPGDGLTTPRIEMNTFNAPVESKPKFDRTNQVAEIKSKTDADRAREILSNYGRKYTDRFGNTLLHLYINSPPVYLHVFANGGVPVNIQNRDGDSALHLAVRAGNFEIVEALLQNSADTGIRNKMGQSPFKEAEDAMKDFLEAFQPGVLGAVFRADLTLIEKFQKIWFNTESYPLKPGVVSALLNGKSQVLDRIILITWANTSSKVKEDKTLMELAAARAEATMDNRLTNCVRILRLFAPTSKLIHSVLCEEVEACRTVLDMDRGWTANVRFRDRKGKTLLSHAVEANNLELVKLLVDKGQAKIDGVRVRESPVDERTLPLFQKSLRNGMNPEICRFLNARMDSSERLEKDTNGNTAFLRAIEEGCSPNVIQWFIHSSNGNCLVERNKDGLTARQLAAIRGNDLLVKTIDRCIIQRPANIAKYSVNFVPEREILDLVDEGSSKTFREILLKQNELPDLEKWINFGEIEKYAERLFIDAANGNLNRFKENYNAKYRDRNGLTALHRAIVFQQYEICNFLCITRPALKGIPDNCNRYPLHYAYSLPDSVCMKFVQLLLEKNPEKIESKVDKDGRCPAEYKSIKDEVEIQTMLYDARTLDVWGKRRAPLGPWPEGSKRAPPDRHVIGRAASDLEE